MECERREVAVAKSFRDLAVWQKGIQLTVLVYQLTKSFPREEIYGLTAQMRRAAISIPSNVAEGAGRLNSPEYRQFLGVARGSNFELLTQLQISKELHFVSEGAAKEVEDMCNEVGRMIYALISGIDKQRSSTTVAAAAQATASHTSHSTLHT